MSGTTPPAAPVVTTFPRRVRTIENAWIPLADGTRLAARLWLPDDADRHPVPAVLEYLPYRKRDFTRGRDEPLHHYVAGHGFASVRVDLRGTGASEGVLDDEYTERELADGEEVIGWLARQPWCTGAVGMIGKSWGGFNALQLAARRPPALRAVIAVCASDDRYADDAHYMGGCLLNENLTWGSVLMAFLAAPPDPALVGDRWRALWRARLDAVDLLPARWLAHPLRDAYWRHGSVAGHYGDIACPVLAVGGWADAYSNAVPRLVAHLPGERRGLVGPWAHLYPHDGAPGPAIGFLQECVAWWDRWLRGGPPASDDPRYRVWMGQWADPADARQVVPGRWVAEDEWPSDRITPRVLMFDDAMRQSAPRGTATLRPRQTTGAQAGEWCAFGAGPDLPGDQREDDAASLAFDSAPLTASCEVLGAPVVRLTLAVDQPVGFVAVRLNDVAPDGAVARVTWGLLNLAHADGHTRVAPMEPGRPRTVAVRLRDIGYAWAPGHRIRVAVSTAWWPIVWPSPRPVTLTLDPAGCALELPERPPHPGDAALRAFGAPERGPGSVRSGLRLGEPQRTRTVDPATGLREVTAVVGSMDPVVIDAIGLAFAYHLRRTYRIHPDDPLSAEATVEQTMRHRRDGWDVQVELATTQRASADAFIVSGRLVAYEGARDVVRREWNVTIPRRGI